MVNPPREGDPSYNLFVREKAAVIDSLRRRARLVITPTDVWK
jgi:alanine transaminase